LWGVGGGVRDDPDAVGDFRPADEGRKKFGVDIDGDHMDLDVVPELFRPGGLQ